MRGENLDNVRTELVARGLRPKAAEQFLAKFAPHELQMGIPGLIVRGLGVVLVLAGGFLILGNRIGFFPTFPFAGTIVLFIGVAILAAARGKWMSSD